MSSSGRKRISKWDSMEDTELSNGNDYYPGMSGSRRNKPQSNSRSRSRSRSPAHRVRRDVGSYDREKSRTRVLSQADRDIDGRYKRDRDSSGWEARDRYPRDGSSDAVVRRHRNEVNGDRETQRRDSNYLLMTNVESKVPCRFFAAGHCRNGSYCRFSHHGVKGNPDGKLQDDRFRHDNNHSGIEQSRNGNKSNEIEVSAPKVNGNWLDDTEMSPDWNYGVKMVKNPLKDEERELKDNGGPAAVAQSLTMDELNHVTEISASLSQLFGNSQTLAPLYSTLKQEQPPLAVFPTSSETVPAGTVPKVDEIPEGAEEKREKTSKSDGKKKGKDSKGMRVFKIALVETVKELLKPAWKEGKMSKEAYKNIVKKVVEKVTGTMQNGNVPQNQEKIDRYLSASRPKLTNLVQAYVNKAKKS